MDLSHCLSIYVKIPGFCCKIGFICIFGLSFMQIDCELVTHFGHRGQQCLSMHARQSTQFLCCWYKERGKYLIFWSDTIKFCQIIIRKCCVCSTGQSDSDVSSHSKKEGFVGQAISSSTSSIKYLLHYTWSCLLVYYSQTFRFSLISNKVRT